MHRRTGSAVVIYQCAPDGTEQPIAFACKTLTSTEKNYSQVEKEALSIIFGVRTFQQYFSGRHFPLTTDHKPLLAIFSPEKSLPVMTLQRLQRWALIMMGYEYHIVYRKYAAHANADALSRLPIGSDPNFDKDESIVEIERSSSVVECRTRNRESPGSNPPLLPFRRLGIFRSLHRRPCSLSCINEYLAIDSGGNVSDLVLARNCCLARMLPGEAENGVGMNRSVREGKKCEAL